MGGCQAALDVCHWCDSKLAFTLQYLSFRWIKRQTQTALHSLLLWFVQKTKEQQIHPKLSLSEAAPSSALKLFHRDHKVSTCVG